MNFKFRRSSSVDSLPIRCEANRPSPTSLGARNRCNNSRSVGAVFACSYTKLCAENVVSLRGPNGEVYVVPTKQLKSDATFCYFQLNHILSLFVQCYKVCPNIITKNDFSLMKHILQPQQNSTGHPIPSTTLTSSAKFRPAISLFTAGAHNSPALRESNQHKVCLTLHQLAAELKAAAQKPRLDALGLKEEKEKEEKERMNPLSGPPKPDTVKYDKDAHKYRNKWVFDICILFNIGVSHPPSPFASVQPNSQSGPHSAGTKSK